MLVKTKPARLFQHTWHAVKVVGKGKACRAAEELRDKRFLSDKAPRLPYRSARRLRVAAAFTRLLRTS